MNESDAVMLGELLAPLREDVQATRQEVKSLRTAVATLTTAQAVGTERAVEVGRRLSRIEDHVLRRDSGDLKAEQKAELIARRGLYRKVAAALTATAAAVGAAAAASSRWFSGGGP